MSSFSPLNRPFTSCAFALLISEKLIIRSNELVAYISGMPPAPEIIRGMDEISDTVSSLSIVSALLLLLLFVSHVMLCHK